jgi:hypothetical protein
MRYADSTQQMSNAAVSAHCPRPWRSLYVYYRVPHGQETAARTAIETMQATLRDAQPGLLTRLMCRADEAGHAPEATWMEVYEHPEGVSQACETQLVALAQALPPGLIGPRHTEIFCPLVPGTTAHA